MEAAIKERGEIATDWLPKFFEINKLKQFIEDSEELNIKAPKKSKGKKKSKNSDAKKEDENIC